MISIRELGESDLPGMALLGQQFYEEGFFPGGYDPSKFAWHWKNLIDAGVAILVGAEHDGAIVGMAGGVMVPDQADGELVAQEMFWFVDQGYRKGTVGKSLLDGMESIARNRGAKRISMVRLANKVGESLDGFLKKHDYQPIEVHYMKSLEA